ncbi:hypothetical protein SAMN05421547_12876 [Delftia lacustris]|uniref:DUF551 domain-containing protein n=1 Tax=Delftia lacustris TaxID=558537 RepID=A0A1H3THK5_9BURK|nr:hypothetical protein SAMN05421547_12876 [Delftia lacustris]
MSNWQPIETAPLSGEFLVTGGTLVGRSAEDRPNTGVAHVERTEDGRFEIVNADYYSPQVVNPSKWHELPDMPA